MKRAETDLARSAFEVEWVVRICVDPKRRFHCAAAIARSCLRPISVSPRDGLDKTDCQQDSDFVEADIAFPVSGRLCELAEHHQLGQRWDAASPPDLGLAAYGFDHGRREVKGQTFVTAAMIVGAHVFVPGMADEDRSGHQVERFAPRVIAETALAHVGQGEAVMHLDERLVGRSSIAPVIDHGYRSASQYGYVHHNLLSG